MEFFEVLLATTLLPYIVRALTGIEINEVRKAFWLNSDKRLENSNVYHEMIFCDAKKFNFLKNAGPISTAIFS